ncbi:putative defense protein [Physella acuta]|uniref:putative defense protein n=1 Tax=Physella acuta TaxID=109671 RepID=UPI0027DB7C09|nr:putative defense protein [Physella acuta]
MFLWVISLFVAIAVRTGSCFPNGVGVDPACTNMIPLHGAASQTTTPPYNIIVSPASYTPGQPVTVTLSGNPSSFKGFMIQARRANVTYAELLGTFTGDSGTRQACYGQALVHADDSNKLIKTFTWNPPAFFAGNVVFRVTFVQSVSKFWAYVPSSLLVPYSMNTVPTLPTTRQPSSTTRKVTHPYVCVGGDCDCETLACDAGMSWHKTGCLLAAILAILSVVYIWQ